MSERDSSGGEFPPSVDDYLYDGNIRRQPHEFDVIDFKFYSRFLEVMDFRPAQLVADIGAGMGHDSLAIATAYGPQAIYMIEPRLSDPGFIDRYFPMSELIRQSGDGRVKLLDPIPEEAAAAAMAQLTVSGFAYPDENISYIQPIEGRAEQLPFPDNSLDRLIINHVIYAVQDKEIALAEAARALKSGGQGGLITNGPGDKSLLKQKLPQMKSILERDAPEGVEYEMPNTVSSKVDYYTARADLQRYFNNVVLFPYHARMKIDADRKPIYNWGFDSYKKLVVPPVINAGRWQTGRREVYGWPAENDPEYASHIAYDTIDIGWILFSDPK